MNDVTLLHLALAHPDHEPNWYAARPEWRIWMEAGARRTYGGRLQRSVRLDRVTYHVPVEVSGRREPVQVTITFYQRPGYDCYGLPPQEYPRVLTSDVDVHSPHRLPSDGALCLYYPLDPPEQRWRPEHGLLALLDLVQSHLFYEEYWRASGGHRGGVWIGHEQPHGLPRERAA